MRAGGSRGSLSGLFREMFLRLFLPLSSLPPSAAWNMIDRFCESCRRGLHRRRGLEGAACPLLRTLGRRAAPPVLNSPRPPFM